MLSIFTLCSDRTPTADAILKTTSLARRYGISSFATHGPLSATVFMVLYLKLNNDNSLGLPLKLITSFNFLKRHVIEEKNEEQSTIVLANATWSTNVCDFDAKDITITDQWVFSLVWLWLNFRFKRTHRYLGFNLITSKSFCYMCSPVKHYVCFYLIFFLKKIDDVPMKNGFRRCPQ